MTIAKTGSQESYAGDGVTVAFSFGYRFFDDTDLDVYIVTDATGVAVLQTLTTHYSVTNTGTESGGTVTMVTAPASGETLLIQRDIPKTQPVDYKANDPFPAETHETALDRLTLQRQDSTQAGARHVGFPVGDTANPELPEAPTRASKLFGFDAAGAPQMYDLSYPLSGSFATRVEFVANVPTLNDGAVVVAEGVFYEAKSGATDIPDLAGFIPAGDFTLEHFGGGTAATATQNAAAFENCQLSLLARRGGGVIQLRGGTYTIGPSPATETYENGGNLLPASNAAMAVRPKISVIGRGVGITNVDVSDQTVQAFYLISPDGCKISDMTINGKWDGVTLTSRSGILNVVPSDADLPKVLDEDFTADVGDFTAAGTDFSIARVTGDLMRCSYGASYTGGGVASAPITTEVGEEYRIIIYLDAATMAAPGKIRVAASTDATTANIFAEKYIGDQLDNYGHTLTFTATGTTTYILIDHDAAVQTDLQSTQFDVSEIRVAKFSTTDQAQWVRDTTLERLVIENIGAYGAMFQDGDFFNVHMRNLRIKNVNGDGIDWKQRGPLADNYGLSVSDILMENVANGLTGTAALDLRGDIMASRITIRGFGKAANDMQGVRFRTYDDQDAPYGGDSARGASLDQFFVSGGLGTGAAVQSGSASTKISNGWISGGTTGVHMTGNTFGSAEYSQVSGVTVNGATTGFRSAAANVVYTGCISRDCTTGWNNSAANIELHGCKDDGSSTPWTDSGSEVQMFGGNLTTSQFQGGYEGDAVTQITSKSTGVEVTKMHGRVTTTADSLGAGAEVSFRVSLDPSIGFSSTDMVLLGGMIPGNYKAEVIAKSGTGGSLSGGYFDVRLENFTASAQAEAVAIDYAIRKSRAN